MQYSMLYSDLSGPRPGTRTGFESWVWMRPTRGATQTRTDSREDTAGFHDEDILLEGCGKGAEEDNASAVAEVQARKHSRTPPTAKKASVNSEAEPRCKRRFFGEQNELSKIFYECLMEFRYP